jgi:hypothetical protein
VVVWLLSGSVTVVCANVFAAMASIAALKRPTRARRTNEGGTERCITILSSLK